MGCGKDNEMIEALLILPIIIVSVIFYAYFYWGGK